MVDVMNAVIRATIRTLSSSAKTMNVYTTACSAIHIVGSLLVKGRLYAFTVDLYILTSYSFVLAALI